MKNKSKIFILAATVAAAMSAAPAQAQNPGFAFGDLVLGFQATGGTGSSNYVLARIGQSGLLRDATTNISLLNIGTELTTAFGANWFERTDLFVGVSAILSNDEFNGSLLNGDPDVTPYVGLRRTSIGTAGTASSFAPFGTGASTQAAANSIFAAHNIFETSAASGVATISKSLSLVDYDDSNPIAAGVQGTAWDAFAGGVQSPFTVGAFGNLGGVSAEAALDLYRIQAFNNVPGQYGFGQPTDVGTFEGTVVIDSTGQVSMINAVPEPTSAILIGLSTGLVGFIRRRRPANS